MSPHFQEEEEEEEQEENEITCEHKYHSRPLGSENFKWYFVPIKSSGILWPV
jgi:hypothetical protein